MEVRLVTTSKRRIKAKPFVRDLRKGMSDRELMEKYILSESQLHNLLRKLVDAGAIDEMELFMRTYLAEGFLTKTFKGAQCAMEEMGHTKETTSLPDPKSPSDVSNTERVNTTSGVFRRMLAKLGRTGS
jgi:hypothetical protein